MTENFFLLIISLLVGILQVIGIWILTRIDAKIENNEKDLKKHIQDHAERKFCKDCSQLLTPSIPTH